MQVVLSTTGRFHFFSLARELERHGVLKCIYSGYVWNVLKRERLPRDKVKTYPFIRSPYVALVTKGVSLPVYVDQCLDYISSLTLDQHVSKHLPDCDIFVGHEGAGLLSGQSRALTGYKIRL